MLPSMECEISVADGLGFVRKNETAVMIIPDVQ
jgi:hypothetical protein